MKRNNACERRFVIEESKCMEDDKETTLRGARSLTKTWALCDNQLRKKEPKKLGYGTNCHGRRCTVIQERTL